MEIIVAVAVAVGGWLITHYLNIKAQNTNFLNQLLNDARLEMTTAIREYQDWHVKINTKIIFLNSSVEVNLPVDWQKEIASFTELVSSDKHTLKWITRLEDYEILFPKTAKCKKQLLGRDIQITQYLRSFLQELQANVIRFRQGEVQRCKDAVKKVHENVQIVADQEGLMEDLRIYLQHLCLSPITKNKIPERKPLDLSVPRLVPDEQGNLQIMVGQTLRKSSEDDRAKKIDFEGPFISRKTAIDWPQGGTTKERYETWLENLKDSLQQNRGFSDWLREKLEKGKRLKVRASIYGIP